MQHLEVSSAVRPIYASLELTNYQSTLGKFPDKAVEAWNRATATISL